MNNVIVDIAELLLLFLWVAPIVIIGMTWYAVRGLSKTPDRLTDADPNEHEDAFKRAADQQKWAKDNGFKPAGTWMFDGSSKIFLALWQHESDPTYFVFYFTDKHSYFDFVTRLSDDHVITSSSSMDGLFFPMPPGFYMQCFTATDKDTLLLKHRRSGDFIADKLSLDRTLSPIDLRQLVVGAIERQVAHIKSLPLWPFRGFYWFLFRRHMLTNKSIEDLWKD